MNIAKQPAENYTLGQKSFLGRKTSIWINTKNIVIMMGGISVQLKWGALAFQNQYFFLTKNSFLLECALLYRAALYGLLAHTH